MTAWLVVQIIVGFSLQVGMKKMVMKWWPSLQGEKLWPGTSRHRRQSAGQDEEVIVCVSRWIKSRMFGLGGDCWDNPNNA